ncbi:MAG: putative ATP-dependent endonuclease of the family, partial [Bradyrhizobium sp.]|nr:putative ATP-dependent endonuclease of the family [Bradyrhizobium sp.]
VQHVPLRDLRLVCLRGGQTVVESLPAHIVSDLAWNASCDGLVRGRASKTFFKDMATGKVASRSWFAEDLAENLLHCYRADGEPARIAETIRTFRHNCRILPSTEDEEELGFHGRRIRGEIFFARRWIMVEGVTEYLLLHALGRAFGWVLDAHGVAVIDFTQSGGAGVYPALAEGFTIPWHMVVDGDAESARFKQNILDRGFTEADIRARFTTLTPPNDLEDQLLADGHEGLLRSILAEVAGNSALTCPIGEFRGRLKHRKTDYMSALASRVAADATLANRMPTQFVQLITNLRDGVL